MKEDIRNKRKGTKQGGFNVEIVGVPEGMEVSSKE